MAHNGRMGSLVWTTPKALRFQINRNDVFATDSRTHSFPQAHTEYASGVAYVDVHFGDNVGPDLFAGEPVPNRFQRTLQQRCSSFTC